MKRKPKKPVETFDPSKFSEEILREFARAERIEHLQRTRGDTAKMRTRLGLP